MGDDIQKPAFGQSRHNGISLRCSRATARSAARNFRYMEKGPLDPFLLVSKSDFWMNAKIVLLFLAIICFPLFAAAESGDSIDFSFLVSDQASGSVDWSEVPIVALDQRCSDCSKPSWGDLSAQFQAGWNNEHLVFLFEVSDSEVDTDGSRRIFDLDSVEILISRRSGDDRQSRGLDLHLIVAADGRWQVANPGGVAEEAIDVASSRSADGYRLAVAIQRFELGKITDGASSHSLNLVVNDRDNEQRESQLFLRYVSHYWQDSQQFPEIKLNDIELKSELVSLFGWRNIDGDDRDWSKGEAVGFSQVCGDCSLPSTDDLSANVQTVWDRENLYFLVRVRDDQFVVNENREIMASDSVVVLIDGNENRNSEFGSDDQQILIRADAQVNAAGSGIQAESTLQDFGYFLEIAIPWTYINGKTPTTAQSYGLVLLVNDRDVEGESKQLFWHLPRDLWQTTADYGTLRLQ